MRYDVYQLRRFDWVRVILLYIALSLPIGILFYDSLLFIVFASPCVYFVAQYERKRKLQLRQRQLKYEFREFISSMASALNAGYALENTFMIIYEDLMRAKKTEECYLALECVVMKRKIEMQQPVEELLVDLAERCGLREMREFARVIGIAKRTGGNMIQIIRDTTLQMEDSMNVEQEIETMVAAKKLEHTIMLFVPFGMIAYLRISNPGYLDCLYGSLFGVIVMSVVLGCIGIAYLWGKQILTFKI